MYGKSGFNQLTVGKQRNLSPSFEPVTCPGIRNDINRHLDGLGVSQAGQATLKTPGHAALPTSLLWFLSFAVGISSRKRGTGLSALPEPMDLLSAAPSITGQFRMSREQHSGYYETKHRGLLMHTGFPALPPHFPLLGRCPGLFSHVQKCILA